MLDICCRDVDHASRHLEDTPWGIVAAIVFQRLCHLLLHHQRGTVIGEDLGHSLSQILIVVIH